MNIYIIDSGVMETHSDFGGRVKAGFDVFDSDVSKQTYNLAVTRGLILIFPLKLAILSVGTRFKKQF